MSPAALARVLVVSTVALAAWPAAAGAHTENSEGYSTITSSGEGIDHELKLDYFELGRVVDLGVQPGVTDGAAATALAARQPAVAAYLDSKVHVFLDEVTCPSRLVRTGVERIHERPYATMGLRFDCPGPASGAYRLGYDVFFNDNDPAHRNIAAYDLGGERGQFVFTVGDRELGAGDGSLASTVRRFLPLGFHHILGGFDHVLFVVALLLGTRTLGEVLKAATAFTAAHSVTLALTALGWLRVPSDVVEPLIALSIVYVAVQNLLEPRLAHRLVAVFGFGLLHGMGFAGTLQLSGEASGALLVSLVSFNAGIELGQGLVIGLLFPVLLALRQVRVSSALQGAATASIAALGALWFFQRLTA